MTVAIATAPVFGIPDRPTVAWKSWGAAIPLLIVALAVMALAEPGEAAACEGTPLTIAELTLPDLIHPA
jgi:hypothetical protein